MINDTHSHQSIRRNTGSLRDGESLPEIRPADGERSRDSEEERQQRIDVLYRVLQHNLRNRMSVILNYADVINDVATDETAVDAAQTILTIGQEVTRLSQKTRQIENAIEADPDRKPIEVTALVSGVVADLREEYPHVDLTTSLPDEAWTIALPSLRLAVENVCENACEHNDSSDPRVEIAVTSLEGDDRDVKRNESDTADEDGGWVHITVADNGPGIPEQDRTAISKGRETKLEHGSGLGLWLTYWIVDNSGGYLRFADNEPRGSVVTIDIPGASPVDRTAQHEPRPRRGILRSDHDGSDRPTPRPERTRPDVDGGPGGRLDDE